MKSKLVEQIVCPECKTIFTLKIKKKQKEEIIQGTLTCTKKHNFPIIRGIPRLVSDNQKDFVDTEDAFSSKWRNFNKTYHNKKWIEGQKKWFLERFGWKTALKFDNFLPIIICDAIFTNGIPMDFATKGIVLLPLGFTSKIKIFSF